LVITSTFVSKTPVPFSAGYLLLLS